MVDVVRPGEFWIKVKTQETERGVLVKGDGMVVNGQNGVVGGVEGANGG